MSLIIITYLIYILLLSQKRHTLRATEKIQTRISTHDFPLYVPKARKSELLISDLHSKDLQLLVLDWVATKFHLLSLVFPEDFSAGS